MSSQKRENTAAIILSLLLAYFTYNRILNDLAHSLSDYSGHAYTYLPLFTDGTFWEGWKAVPYCLWHLCVLGLHKILFIPYEIAVASVSIILEMISFYIFYWMLLKYSATNGTEINSVKAAFITFGLTTVQPLYFSWLDSGDRYMGPFSMNPIHNPTQMSARPFALLSFCLVYDILNKIKITSYKGTFINLENGLKKPYICLIITLFLSTLFKPTFSEMFIPTVAFIMLAEWIGHIKSKNSKSSAYFIQCINMLFCALPSLIYIVLSILGYSVLKGSYASTDAAFIITKPFEVWHIFSENVILSVLIGLAFPLFLFFFDSRFFLKDNMGRLSLVGYTVGFTEAAFLTESGKQAHGDFLWPMMWGMALLFISAVFRLTTLEQTQAYTKQKQRIINIAWFLFWLHVMFGLLYIKEFIK